MASLTAAAADPTPAESLHTLKIRLAACCRVLHMEGILTYSGHVSARLPGRDGFLIHPFVESRAAISAKDLLACGLDGALLPESAPGEPPLERFIHSEIYRARPDVQAIGHTHSELAAAFTLANARLLPVKSHAVRWASGIPIHPDPSHIKTSRQGHELAATLAHHNAALLRAHGGVIVAESVQALLVDAVHFEENARAQIQALSLGTLLPLTSDELELLRSHSNRAQHVDKLWRYYVSRGLAAGLLDSDEALQ